MSEKSFYSDSQIEEICSALGIKDESLHSEFKNLLEQAARNYLNHKAMRENKLTKGDENKNFRNFPRASVGVERHTRTL